MLDICPNQSIYLINKVNGKINVWLWSRNFRTCVLCTMYNVGIFKGIIKLLNKLHTLQKNEILKNEKYPYELKTGLPVGNKLTNRRMIKIDC